MEHLDKPRMSIGPFDETDKQYIQELVSCTSPDALMELVSRYGFLTGDALVAVLLMDTKEKEAFLKSDKTRPKPSHAVIVFPSAMLRITTMAAKYGVRFGTMYGILEERGILTQLNNDWNQGNI